MFNNVIQWRLWGIQVRHQGSQIEAQVLSENDIFDATFVGDGRAQEGVRFFDQGNAARVSNPLLLNGAGIRERNPGSVFAPSALYPYVIDPVEVVFPSVTSVAGPRG
jgi:pectate lyase